MYRPRAYTIAAALLAFYCLVSLFFQISSLALGSDAQPDGPPFFIAVINFAICILGLVAVYGVWRVQKWAVTLAVAVSGISILTSELPAIIFAPVLPLRLSGVFCIVLLGAVIALLLRPAELHRRAAGEAPVTSAQTTAGVE